jgi:penicillin-binding protein 1A
MAKLPHEFEDPRARGWRRWLYISGLVAGNLAGFAIAAFIGAYIYFTWHLDPNADLNALNRVPSVTFTDEKGVLIASRGSSFGEQIPLAQMPAHVKAAFIGAEDRRFYEHFGLDIWGLSRAMYFNIASGRLVQGGSTITQQLARSLFLSTERTLARKIEEMFLAIWLERHLSKDQILELYLNRIYLGSGAYGVDAAARRYYGISVKEANLAQAAMLAAMTRAPARYAPTNDLAGARTRAALVLDAMIETGYISHGDAYASRAVPAGPGENKVEITYNYFADYVATELEALGIPLDQDLIVRTTINRDIQLKAQQVITEDIAKNAEAKGVSQAGAVVMTTDGAIRAIVGGVDYIDSPFNRATQAMRQPGSAFKPFVYLTALEQGFRPSDMRYDEPVTIGKWTPANYGGTYTGPVTLSTALAKSINTVAAALGNEVGTENVVQTATRMGITSPMQAIPSLALGTSEVTLLELAGAYAPFAKTGVSVAHYAIVDVKRPSGEVVYQRKPAQGQTVIADRIARNMNQMLGDVVRFGTGRGAALGQRPVAGKTGTSQDFRDAWFIGYTADYVGGVWIGNDDNTPMDKVVGGSLPAAMWRQIMTTAHDGVAVKPLPGWDEWDEPSIASSDRWEEQYWNEGPPPEAYYEEEQGADDDDRGGLLDWLFGPNEPRRDEPRRSRRDRRDRDRDRDRDPYYR